MIGTNQVLYFGVAAHRTGDAHKGGYLAAYLFEWIDYTTQQQITHQRADNRAIPGQTAPPPRPYLMFAIFSDRHFLAIFGKRFQETGSRFARGGKKSGFSGALAF